MRALRSDSFAAGAAVAALSASVLVVLAEIARALTVGSQDGGWLYPYVGDRFTPLIFAPFVVVFALAAALLWLTRRTLERHEAATLGGWMIAGLVGQLILRWHAPAPLDAIVRSDSANSFYTVARQHGPADLIRRFPEIRETLASHARTNMPGKVLLYSLLEQATANPRLLALALMALSNAGGWLLYLVVFDLFGDRWTAAYALILYLFMPGRLFFMPLLNTISPIVVLGCLFLHVRMLRAQRWPWAIALGVALFALAFFEPLPLTMGLLFVAVIVAALVDGRIRIATAAWLVAVVTLAFASTYLLARLAGYDLVAGMRYALQDARHFNVVAARSYRIWVVQNLIDFALCTGVASAALIPAAIAAALDDERPWRERLTGPVAVWAAGTIAVIAFLDVAGVNRGEVVRLWIFAGCFVQVLPASLCARARSVAPFAIVLAGLLLEAAVGIARVGYVLP